MICVARADADSRPEGLVTVDGRQYEVFAVHDALSELGQPDESAFDFDQEDAWTARLAILRVTDNQDLRDRIKVIDIVGLRVAAGK